MVLTGHHCFQSNIKSQAKTPAIADGFITLSATGAAPVGLDYTGDPAFNLAASFTGAPALSLPCLSVEEMPVGIQLMGFKDGDEALFAHARWVEKILHLLSSSPQGSSQG